MTVDNEMGMPTVQHAVDVSIKSSKGRSAGTFVPDASMEYASEQGCAWVAKGERPCFTLSVKGCDSLLSAGWYRFAMNLRHDKDVSSFPSFHITYTWGATGDPKIVLPQPGPEGAVNALILFKHPVDKLRLCPIHGPGTFNISDIRIESVSRVEALRRMVGMPPSGAGGWVQRLLGFIKAVSKHGLTAATDTLYRDYCARLAPGDSDNYGGWCDLFDAVDADRIQSLASEGRTAVESGPLVSLILPVYETPDNLLRRCIDSVLGQAYGRWELCIVDDASPSPHVGEVLTEYAARDARIKIARRERNGHISQASNSALSLVTGEYVGLLDHDDELRPHALLEFVQARASNPEMRLCYSDEDKVDLRGRRFDPYFKPDFDIDLLRGQNYLCHFTLIDAGLVKDVGGFREGYEGSQDHDLFLRCVERLRSDQVVHIPKVLYHWRAIPGSTALSRDAKDYASSAGARAVADHLHRTGTNARVEELSHGHYRVHWPLPSPAPKVSLLIPTRDKVELLKQCVDSILQESTYPDYEILIIDNGSVEPATQAYLAEATRDARVRVIHDDRPFNYSRLNNSAATLASGSVLALINNDIEVITPDWLEEMVSHACRSDVGAVGAMLYYPNDTIQHAGVILGIDGVAAHIYSGMPRGYPGHGGRARVVQSLSAVTAACLVVRREVFEAVGGLDESLAVAFNDIDFCLRVRAAGFRNIWTPFAELYHHESASRGHEDTDEKRARFSGEVARMQERWGEELSSDPAYNPNLTLTGRNFELAIPPRLTH